MKKLLLTLGVTILCLGLTACGNEQTPKSRVQLKSSSSKEPGKSQGIKSQEEELRDSQGRLDLKKLQDKISVFNPDTFDQSKYDSYFSYNSLLTKPDVYFSKRLKLSNLEISQVTNLENCTVYMAYTTDDDLYMLFLENERVKSELLEGDDVTFFCRFLMNDATQDLSGSVSYYPIMYVDEYILNNWKMQIASTG